MNNTITKKILTIILFSVNFTFFSFADTSYSVQKGDTLYSISKKYQITVAELRAANNLSESDVLKAGQKLTIPEADIGTATALSATKSTSAASVKSEKTIDYIVQKGDTLYRIAKNNNMTVPDLLSLNNLDSSAVIKVGQKLKIVQSVDSSTNNTKTVVTSTKQEVKNKTAEKAPDTRNYGTPITTDSSVKWPVKNPKITPIKGKVSGVQLSAAKDEKVTCIHEGTVMYVGIYRGFGQVLFVQTKTGLIYAYTGMGSVKVKKGDYVISGAELGTVGVDSISGNPQLTFMVFQNGKPMDPAKAPRN